MCECTLHACKSRSVAEQVDFIAKNRLLSSTGALFDIHGTQSVALLMGEVGAVFAPQDYADYPRGATFYCKEECSGLVVAYAAVRFYSAESQTFVIDTMGVSNYMRGSGLGRIFVEEIKKDIRAWAGEVCLSQYTVSLQSVFDYDIYTKAVTANCKHDKRVVEIDMSAIVGEMTGSCQFWRKCGFDHQRLIITNPATIFSPILMMWCVYVV